MTTYSSITVSGIVSVAAVAVTSITAFFGARRSQWDRVLGTLDYLTSGQVASARHELGSLIYGTQPLDPGQRADRIRDLFIILWAFQRIEAVRVTVKRWPSKPPREFLEKTTKSWVEYWSRHLDEVVERLGGPDINGTRTGLDELRKAWKVAESLPAGSAPPPP